MEGENFLKNRFKKIKNLYILKYFNYFIFYLKVDLDYKKNNPLLIKKIN